MIAGLPDWDHTERPVCWAHGPHCPMQTEICAPLLVTDPERYIAKGTRQVVEEIMRKPHRLRVGHATLVILALSLALWTAVVWFGLEIVTLADLAIGAMR